MPTIAYLGPEHTNAHLAAQKRFGLKARYIHEPTVDDVFTSVERNQSDFGIVPVENSLEGVVTHTLDRFIDFVDTPLRIVGEVELPIQHYLVVKNGTKISDIKTIYSHPQALAQCRKWIHSHISKSCQLEEMLSTAEAVRYIKNVHITYSQTTQLSHEEVVAAIGTREAAKQHDLKAIAIPNERDNKTRFLILGKKSPARKGRNKTSILFAVKDKPGALYDALVPFKYNKINLTKIESRPSKKKAWEYLFFIDLEGHASEPRVKKALQALGRSTSLLRVLGSYPISK